MTRRRRNPIEEQLKRAAGAAVCEAGLHMAPNRNGKCPRCKKNVENIHLPEMGLLGLLVGLFFQGLQHGEQLRGHPPSANEPAPILNWRAEMGIPPFEKVTPESVNQRYKQLAKLYHPDPADNAGGNPEAFIRLMVARDAALKELGG